MYPYVSEYNKSIRILEGGQYSDTGYLQPQVLVSSIWIHVGIHASPGFHRNGRGREVMSSNNCLSEIYTLLLAVHYREERARGAKAPHSPHT